MKILKTIVGKVIHGTSGGKKIGFPTVNVATQDLDLPFGVYACKVHADGVYKGALHFGPRRILDLMEPALEVHLLDFDGDLYGREVKIEVLTKIRTTRDFADMETLKKQIKLDVEAIRTYLGDL